MSALSPEQLARLQEAVRAGDAARYYGLLAEYGFGYGIIAGRVVQKTDLTGYIAHHFFENKASRARHRSDAGAPCQADAAVDDR